MPGPLVRSCLASAILLAASIVLAATVTWHSLALQNLHNEWLDYRQQTGQQRKPVWLSVQDQARLKQLAERGALRPVDPAITRTFLAGLVETQFAISNLQIANPVSAGSEQGPWRLASVALEFDVWLLHEPAFSQFWSRLQTIPGWLDISACRLGRSATEGHPAGILMHCSGELVGFGPAQPPDKAPHQ